MVFIDVARFDTDHGRTINFARLQRTRKIIASYTLAIPWTASIDSSSIQNITRNIFHRSIPIFRTCTFRGITPSLLKSSTRKARNEFQLPALANIRSTSSTRDATDSKSRRFLETSANPTHVPRGCGTLWFRDLQSPFCYARWKSSNAVQNCRKKS